MKKKLLFVDLAICSLWMLSALGGRDSWEQPVFALSVLGVMTRFVVSFSLYYQEKRSWLPLGVFALLTGSLVYSENISIGTIASYFFFLTGLEYNKVMKNALGMGLFLWVFIAPYVYVLFSLGKLRRTDLSWKELLGGILWHELIGMYREELELLRTQKAKCLSRMREICQKHFPKQMKDLQTMPGVREQSAMQIIAEIGVDMRTFLTAAMLVGWAGFKPRNDESNKKLKSRSITHGNKYLKKLMVECAWGATRTQGCFYSQFSYHQTQVRKKNAMKVRVAVARKQLVGIWHILSEGCTYKEYSEKKEEGES